MHFVSAPVVGARSRWSGSRSPQPDWQSLHSGNRGPPKPGSDLLRRVQKSRPAAHWFPGELPQPARAVVIRATPPLRLNAKSEVASAPNARVAAEGLCGQVRQWLVRRVQDRYAPRAGETY